MDLKIYERETEQQMREDDYRFDNEYMTNMRSDIDADEEMLSIDNYTMTPVFDAKDRQRKFNAYLVDDDENLIRIQDTDPAGIDSYEYGLIQEYLKNYVSISEGEDTEDEMDSERHSRQGSNDESYCNGIEYLEDKGQEATAERTTIKHNYYKTSSFRETCFPRLWARTNSEDKVNETQSSDRRRTQRPKTTKGRQRRARKSHSAVSSNSWATGFLSTSDVSLISSKPHKLFSGSYDVRYTSTSLILLNNKLRQEVNKLRRSDSSETATPRIVVNPQRHERVLSGYSLGHHSHCYDSSTPVPQFPSSPSIRWLKSVTPTRFLEKYSVNSKRHKSCIPTPKRTFILDSLSHPVETKSNRHSILSPYAEETRKK